MDKLVVAESFIRLKNGDISALKDIYEELKVPLYTYICRITLSRSVAEDVLHDTFLKLAKPSDADVKNAIAYIYCIARNTAIDAVRKQKNNCTDEMPDRYVFENDSDIKMDVESAINSLDDDVRQIITLRISSELTFKDISRILNTSLSSVYRKYVKGISELKQKLS